MKITSHSILLLAAVLGLALESTALAQDVMNIGSPPNAPIYVLEGQLAKSFHLILSNVDGDARVQADASMDINTGAIDAVGRMELYGEAFSRYGRGGVDATAVMTLKGVAKQAGTAIRWSGKAAIKGGGFANGPDRELVKGLVTAPIYDAIGNVLTPAVYGFPFVQHFFVLSATLTCRDMELNPATGEQSGMMSISGSLKDKKLNIPLQQAPMLTVIPRPQNLAGLDGWMGGFYTTSYPDGWRDMTGRWSTSVRPSTDSKGKVTGTAELVIGDPSDPYATVAQKITGKLDSKTGVVSITGVGINKSTSKVKILLNYWLETGELVPNKNSISAYGQTQRF